MSVRYEDTILSRPSVTYPSRRHAQHLLAKVVPLVVFQDVRKVGGIRVVRVQEPRARVQERLVHAGLRLAALHLKARLKRAPDVAQAKSADGHGRVKPTAADVTLRALPRPYSIQLARLQGLARGHRIVKNGLVHY
jgi:hypothetical protein